jgi:tetratricopeptide (TPR) repeat protein
MRAAPASLRRLLALVLALAALSFAAVPAGADDAPDRAALDRLFAELQSAPDAETAHRIDQRIWQLWTSPSDEVLRLRMLDVLEARSAFDLQRALKLLDDMVVDFPGYAEAWNQRATIYYMLGNYEASLADIDKVLALEPRHFGALAGRVLIYLAEGKRQLALKDMVNALAIHPFLSEKQLFPELQQGMTRI